MVHDYYHIPAEELGRGARVPLTVLGDSGEVFYELALEMVSTIREHNERGEKTVFICPVGPVGQYPIFVRLVNEERLSLKNCWFINMDEYLTDDDRWIDEDDPLSFRGFMNRTVYGQIDPGSSCPPSSACSPTRSIPVAFPPSSRSSAASTSPLAASASPATSRSTSPTPPLTPEEFAQLKTRTLDIHAETRATNCIGDLGGALEDMPHRCVTIGMSEILGARKVRLGVFRDWHRAVIRRTAYGEVSSDFPATLLQNHPDARVYVNANAAQAAY